MTDAQQLIFAALAAPIDPRDIKTRRQGGRDLSYITARTVMNRLDDVLGPDGWWDEYQPLDHSVICKLTIRLPDGSIITKSDAGGCAGMADAGDDDKSGFSDAFKRAAVKFGIGRHLYGDGVPAFVREPSLPSKAGAPGSGQGAAERPRRRSRSIDSTQDLDRPLKKIQPVAPRTGRELDDWIKQCRIDPNVLTWIRNEICTPRRWPQYLPKWSDGQVAEALPLIGHHLRSMQAARGATP